MRQVASSRDACVRLLCLRRGAPTPPVISQVTMTVPAGNPNCREWTATATIEGKLQPIVGRACLQPNGTWKVNEGTPQQPDQYVYAYVPPYDGSLYAYDPWLWWPPIGVSVGAFVFVDRDHHLHHFDHRFAANGFHSSEMLHRVGRFRAVAARMRRLQQRHVRDRSRSGCPAGKCRLMLCHLARPIVRTLAAAALLGSTAYCRSVIWGFTCPRGQFRGPCSRRCTLAPSRS